MRRLGAAIGGAAILSVLAGGAPATANGVDPSPELERYAPTLRYAQDEEYFAQPISREPERIDRDVVYGHEVEAEGDRFLQYWLYYAYNDQDRGILRTGRHEGDWEFVQLRMAPDGAPVAMTFAQHSGAERCGWGEIETTSVDGDTAPVVYVANGSHAAYPRAGTADRPWPDPNDVADGEGLEVRPDVDEIADEHPAWVQRAQPWGGSVAGWFPGEQSSPLGPFFKADDRWHDPAAFEAAARDCGEPPPGRPWQAPVTVAFALILLMGAGLLIRRRRRA